MNKEILDLLKNIRILAGTIKGGFKKISVHEIDIEDRWVEYPMQNPQHVCLLRKLINTDKQITISIHAPAGSAFQSSIYTDADATFQVATGRLYAAVAHVSIDMHNPYTFPINTLHEIQVIEESIFTITYTNFK